MEDPITHTVVRAFIQQTPVEEAVRVLTELRDLRKTQMDEIFEEVSLALDHYKFCQVFAPHPIEAWFEREFHEWGSKRSKIYQKLSDEHRALGLGLDEILGI